MQPSEHTLKNSSPPLPMAPAIASVIPLIRSSSSSHEPHPICIYGVRNHVPKHLHRGVRQKAWPRPIFSRVQYSGLLVITAADMAPIATLHAYGPNSMSSTLMGSCRLMEAIHTSTNTGILGQSSVVYDPCDMLCPPHSTLLSASANA